MTRPRKPAKAARSTALTKTVPPAPPSPLPESPDVAHKRVLFRAWASRMRDEIHWIQDEFTPGGLLRDALSDDQRFSFVHSLECMWFALTDVLPADPPAEFARKGGAL